MNTMFQIFVTAPNMMIRMRNGITIRYHASACMLQATSPDTDSIEAYDVQIGDAYTLILKDNQFAGLVATKLPVSLHAFVAWACGFRGTNLLPSDLYDASRKTIANYTEMQISNGAIRMLRKNEVSSCKVSHTQICASIDESIPLSDNDIILALSWAQGYIPREWISDRLTEYDVFISPGMIYGGHSISEVGKNYV